MKTSKLISTISYNTKEFLKSTLDELVKNKKLEYWFAINHEPEIDEKKAHFHVLMCPNGKIDTVDLRQLFIEPDPNNPDMPPLNCLPIRTSKSFGEWYLYAIHHKGYLMSKGESRIHSYCFKNMFGSDLDLLASMVEEIDVSRYRCYEEVFRSAELGIPFSTLIANGIVPLGWIYQFKELYNALRHEIFTERNQRSNHEFTEDTIIEVNEVGLSDPFN